LGGLSPPPQAARKAPRKILKMRRSRADDNFKFFYELIITHYSKFFKKNELEKFTALAANSFLNLFKRKPPEVLRHGG